MKMERYSLETYLRHHQNVCKSNVLGTRFATCRISTFPMRILDISRIGNCIQKRHVFPMEMECNSLEKYLRYPQNVCKSNVFGARFATSRIPTFPMRILDILRIGNRIQKRHGFPMKMERDSLEKSFRHPQNVYKSNVFEPDFRKSEMLDGPKEYLSFCKSENAFKNSLYSYTHFPIPIFIDFNRNTKGI